MRMPLWSWLLPLIACLLLTAAMLLTSSPPMYEEDSCRV